MATKLKVRRGTASRWAERNPILSAGEFGYESDTRKIKVSEELPW